MSFLNTTATLHHRTPLPQAATLEKALDLFHDHDFLIRLDPELANYESCSPPQGTPDAGADTKYYRVTDHMHTLPRGLWDTTVSFGAEITNTDNGVVWVIKAPLGLMQRSVWAVVPAKDGDIDEQGEKSTLCLTEDVEITCSRLLVGTVKSKCEGNYRGVHRRFIERLVKPET